jgi:hypothetical protein
MMYMDRCVFGWHVEKEQIVEDTWPMDVLAWRELA